MTKPVGGRGYKAPYTTTHVRVPTDIKPEVERLIEQYRNKTLGVTEDNLLTISDNNLVPTLDEGVELALGILNGRQSARKSMAALLSAIYGVQVKL